MDRKNLVKAIFAIHQEVIAVQSLRYIKRPSFHNSVRFDRAHALIKENRRNITTNDFTESSEVSAGSTAKIVDFLEYS